MTDKPGRGGSRKGAGRKPKSNEKRVQKSVSLTPTVWNIIAADQAKHGGSESDAIERLLSNR
jgi:hypothetical protein